MFCSETAAEVPKRIKFDQNNQIFLMVFLLCQLRDLSWFRDFELMV
jgi:hypothetical protein